jgi:hypothetical protein
LAEIHPECLGDGGAEQGIAGLIGKIGDDEPFPGSLPLATSEPTGPMPSSRIAMYAPVMRASPANAAIPPLIARLRVRP